jgi:hypothetical protein
MMKRNAQALAAWMRGGAGSHGGPKKPDYDETEEGFSDYLDYKEEKHDDKEGRIPVRTGQESN